MASGIWVPSVRGARCCHPRHSLRGPTYERRFSTSRARAGRQRRFLNTFTYLPLGPYLPASYLADFVVLANLHRVPLRCWMLCVGSDPVGNVSIFPKNRALLVVGAETK
jgi:hypothetical protein